MSRLIANTIDFAILVIALAGCYLAINAVRFLWSTRNFQFVSVNRLVAFIVGAVLLSIYLTVAWGLVGRTIGERVLGLRVVSRSGGTVRLPIAAVRALLCVLFPIGILWVAVSRKDRSAQDVVLHTSVRYDW